MVHYLLYSASYVHSPLSCPAGLHSYDVFRNRCRSSADRDLSLSGTVRLHYRLRCDTKPFSFPMHLTFPPCASYVNMSRHHQAVGSGETVVGLDTDKERYSRCHYRHNRSRLPSSALYSLYCDFLL